MPLPRRNFKHKSAQEEANYYSIINGMIDTAWVISKEAQIIAVNDSAVSLLGYTKQEFLANGLSLIDSSLKADDIKELIRTLPNDKIQVFETTHRTKDGRDIPVEICSSLIMYNGEQQILSIARDITERKWAEAEIKKQLQEKQTLLRAIHHRIKNNIASLESLLSIKSQTITNIEAKTIINDAIGRVECIRILYELLLQTDDFTHASVKAFFCKIVESVIPLYSHAEEITWNCDVDDFTLSGVYLFPLGVILEELLNNILKYAFDKTTFGVVTLSVKKIMDTITFSVTDNGRGLPENFDTKNSFGLTIVKMLAQQINSDFFIGINPEGKGTVCKLSFRL